jgi:PAS domain S-box-containing protein
VKIERLSSIVFGASAAVLCMVVVLFFDAEAVERHLGEQRTAVIDKLSTARAKIEAALNSRLSLVVGMAAFVKSGDKTKDNQPGAFSERFQIFSSEILKDIGGIRSLQLAPDAVVMYVNPLKGNEAALGHDLRADPARRDVVERAIQERKFIVAGPVELRQGGVALIGRLPIFLPSEREQKERFWGFSIILIDLEPLLEAGGLLEKDIGLRYAIRGKDGLGAEGAVFYGEEALFNANPVVLEVYLPNGFWQIAAVPAKGWGGETSDRINLWIFGSAVAGAVGFLMFVLLNRPAQLRSALSALRESEEKNRLILNSAGEGIYGLDLEGKTTFVNPTVCELLGYTADELIGQPMHSLVHHSYPDGTAFPREKCPIYAAFTDGEVHRITDEVLWRKDGSSFQVEYTSNPIRANGELIGAVVIFNDITGRKQAEAQIVQSAMLATLGEMATSVAHQLNQPLNVIRLAAGNMARKLEKGSAEPAYLGKKLKRIASQTERAAAIIDHMRMFGREAEAKPTELDPRDAVRGALQLMGEQLRLAEIEVSVDLPETCRPVLGHRVQMEQVILNLLTNARDAIQENLGERKITLAVDDTGADAVRIVVGDTGGGIPENALNRIFEPFYTTKELNKGTGLGLSVSYGIVRDMGGAIEVENIEGGTRFRIMIPVAKEAAEAPPPEA